MADFKRQVAVKTNINGLIQIAAAYTTEELVTNIGRVNILCTVIRHEEGTLSVEDGTGRLLLRSFDRPELIESAPLGVPVLVVGKPRIYDAQCYLIPEIIRRLDNHQWIEVRRRELTVQPLKLKMHAAQVQATERIEDTPVAQKGHSSEQLLNIIRELDSGTGATVEEVARKLPQAEEAIAQLLLRGEIFQLRPGVVKVLE